MKTPLYLVAMRSVATRKQMIWISTTEFKNDNTVVVLDTFEIVYEVKQSDEEIETLLDSGKYSEIERLEARLMELKNETA